MKTIKVVPVDIGDVHLVLTLEVRAPAAVIPSARHNQGKRLPENLRKDIEKRLLAGEKPPKIAAATGVSSQIVYIMRSRMRTEGLIGEPAFNRMADGRPKGLLDYDLPASVPVVAVEEIEVEEVALVGDDVAEEEIPA